MSEPRERDFSFDPVLYSANTALPPVSSKPSGPGIVYSPEYKAQKLANATSLLSNVAAPQAFLAMQKPVRYAPDGNYAVQPGGPNSFNSPITIDGNYAVQPGGPNSFNSPITMTEPEKKPNYILWAAIALGGFFIVRKLIK
jgi:hypothetical protein